MTGARSNAVHATLTNGRNELPASAHGVLVLADPPEAGWRMRTRSNEEATIDAELLAAPDYEPDYQQACDTHGSECEAIEEELR
jgi:hypothetical protein